MDVNHSLSRIEGQLKDLDQKFQENPHESELIPIFQKSVTDLEAVVDSATLDENEWKQLIAVRAHIDHIVKNFGDEVPEDIAQSRDSLIAKISEKAVGTLNQLPDEVQLFIFDFLEEKDLAALKLAGRRTKDIASDPSFDHKLWRKKFQDILGKTGLYRQLMEDDSTDWKLAYETYLPLKDTPYAQFDKLMKYSDEIYKIVDIKSAEDQKQVGNFFRGSVHSLILDEGQIARLKEIKKEVEESIKGLNLHEAFHTCYPLLFFRPGQYLNAIQNTIDVKDLKKIEVRPQIMKLLTEDNPLLYCVDENSMVSVVFRVKHSSGEEAVMALNQVPGESGWDLNALPVKENKIAEEHSNFSESLSLIKEFSDNRGYQILYNILHGRKAFISELDPQGESGYDPNSQFWAVGFS